MCSSDTAEQGLYWGGESGARKLNLREEETRPQGIFYQSIPLKILSSAAIQRMSMAQVAAHSSSGEYMSSAFSHSLRTLGADRFSGSITGILIAAVLLGAWGLWAVFARVTLYEVSDAARLEVDQQVHPIQASAAGRVVATRLRLDQEVQAGEVLVELDAQPEQLRVEEERASLAALSAQLSVLEKEIQAEGHARQEDQRAAQAALREAQVQLNGAQTALGFAQEEAGRLTELHQRGYAAELDLLRARAEVEKRRTTADAARLEITRLEKDQHTRQQDRTVRLENLKREISRLSGQQATSQETIERLRYDTQQRQIRAPIAGRLGEVADLRIGAFVAKGDRLAAIVPHGQLRAVAYYPPPPALGRIRSGQLAQLRLKGFPWAQYGSVDAQVTRVASEVRDGRVRVDLAIQPDPASVIPLQHGLPGTIEIAVDQVSPATLLLRLAGQLLARPTTWAEAKPATDTPANRRETP